MEYCPEININKDESVFCFLILTHKYNSELNEKQGFIR